MTFERFLLLVFVFGVFCFLPFCVCVSALSIGEALVISPLYLCALGMAWELI